MKRQRFTNGTKKVLKRQYTSPEQIENIADNAVSNGSLWERGTGEKSLKPKGNSCLAGGANSMAKGVNSNAYMRNVDSYAIQNNYTADVITIQKNQVNLHLAIDKDGDSYFINDIGDHFKIPGKFWWKGRFMVMVLNFVHDQVTTWSGIFTAHNINGNVVIRQSTVTQEADENTNNYTLTLAASGDKLEFVVNSKNSEKAYGVANIEWIEIQKK
jgi:carbonic anhydrase